MRKLNLSAPLRLLVLLLFFGLAAPAAFAQEYREAYNAGLSAAREKNLEEAYTQFSLALEGARAAEDDEVARRAGRILAQIDYNRGARLAQDNKHSEALSHFEKGVSNDSTYANNFLGQGLALRGLNRNDEAVDALRQAVAVGEGDVKEQATTALRSAFVADAATALRGENPSAAQGQRALARLQAMQEVIEADAEAYFYLALAHAIAGNTAEAVAAADAGLALNPDRDRKASLYYAKGEAYRRSGNNDAAKTAYRQVASGTYKAVAEHYVTTL